MGQRKGYKQTTEHIRKRMLNHIGAKRSLKTRENISKAKIGKKINLSLKEYNRRKISWLGKNNPRWNNGHKIEDHRYILIYMPNHPRKNNNGYVREHILVMEKKLGRFLTKQEVVHHLDCNPKNNDISNLYLFPNQSEHAKYHRMIEKAIRKELNLR